MGMVNSKSLRRLLKEATKALGREPTNKELCALLNGDNSVLSKKKTNEEESK